MYPGWYDEKLLRPTSSFHADYRKKCNSLIYMYFTIIKARVYMKEKKREKQQWKIRSVRVYDIIIFLKNILCTIHQISIYTITTKYSLDMVTRNIHCSYNVMEFTNIKKEIIGISRHTSRCKKYFFLWS